MTWGANENTPVVGMKSQFTPQLAEELTERMDVLYKALRNGDYTDETFKLIENQFEIIKSKISLVAKDEPSEDTPKADEPIDILTIWKSL